MVDVWHTRCMALDVLLFPLFTGCEIFCGGRHCLYNLILAAAVIRLAPCIFIDVHVHLELLSFLSLAMTIHLVMKILCYNKHMSSVESAKKEQQMQTRFKPVIAGMGQCSSTLL